jgi:FMN phosphatase YigB (HAD superfamily)
MKDIKVIVWDQRGVLLKNKFGNLESYLLSKYGIEEDLLKVAKASMKDRYRSSDNVIDATKKLVEYLKLDVDVEDFLKDRFDSSNHKNLDQRLVDIMWRLDKSGYIQTYLTNGVAYYLKTLVMFNKVPRLIEGVESEVVGISKPDIRMYKYIPI